MNTPLPKLSALERDDLEAPVRDAEILTTIKKLANGKSPGGDGYTIEFYKQFQNSLSPVLIQLYDNIIENKSMPATMPTVTISLLPKSGKDHLDMGNFHTLSLLNNDYKVLAKVLALHLEEVITSLVHIDQVGFIPGRSSANNMRRSLQVMLKASSHQCPAVAISLDAEKAFDRLEWPYLFQILSRYGLGPSAVQWFKALYNIPVATVKVSGLISKPFLLHRGTRQGCPLSPLIFVLALEPLACTIRKHANITGMRLFSGYQINWSKSEAIPLNSKPFSVDLETTPFVWRPEGMRYLGITIRSPVSKILRERERVSKRERS